jgi:DNA polymerase
MSYIVLDFETYYDKDYSLRKMTPPEYILDPRFEVMGCAVIDPQLGTGTDAVWFDADGFADYAVRLMEEQLHTRKLVIISHNALFDMCLLAWRYGIVPDLMVDTMGMARALIFGYTGKVSLDATAQFLGLEAKGTTIKNVSGMRTADIKAAGLWQDYMDYAKHDAELCRDAFEKMKPHFPRQEFAVMDMVIRCAVEPRFQLDQDKLALHYNNVVNAKEQLLNKCGLEDRTALMSNDKFAEVLRSMGVDPPMKTSLTTGNMIYAFAKSDPAMAELEEHPSPEVQALVAARLGYKSTLEETRTQRLLSISRLNWPSGERWMPMPLRYSGAHTHRLSGDWKLNQQNLPRNSVLRDALCAPDGHTVVTCDAAQIEARIVAWLAGQDDLTQAFREKRDVYSEFAETVFKQPVSKDTPKERFVGKTSILGLGYGMGAPKFTGTIRTQSRLQLGEEIPMTLEEGTEVVLAYRQKYPSIPRAWQILGNMLPEMLNEKANFKFGPCRVQHEAILLPNGLRLFYPELAQEEGKDGERPQWVCKYAKRPKRLFGGKLYENIVQALARIILFDAALEMAKRYPAIKLAHQVHDELIYIVPSAIMDEFKGSLHEVMSTPRGWYKDLPLAAEAAAGPNYGEAKS